MARPVLSIDLHAMAANWQALDRLTAPATQTAAVVKADAYGLGAAQVALALARAGARRFFVADAREGAALRKALGRGPQVALLSGHMAGEASLIAEAGLTPILNSIDQASRHFEALPGHGFGLALDTGMNRLGMNAAEWEAAAPVLLPAGPEILLSHLACADDPDHPMNTVQLARFRALTDGTGVPRSLAATGGILLGRAYHFDLTRPGIGLHGARPFAQGARPLRLSLPVIQTREIAAGESVGYGATWTAEAPTRLATLAAGYADGLPRALSNRAQLWHGDLPCPLVGRVSMDLIVADIGHLPDPPDSLDILGPAQGIDDLADAAGTIGYEILTALSARYDRHYTGAAA
jgi:alanine racemase